MTKVLLTGAGGYIGSVLTRALLEKGHSVIAVDRYFFGEEVLQSALASGRLTIVKDDIRDLTPAAFEGVDAVMDLAALSNDPAGDLDPDMTYGINHRGRAHVARCAKEAGVRRYILSSSCSVYGRAHGERMTEQSALHPVTTYAQANLRAEQDTLPLADGSFTCSAIRNATVFGLSQRMRFDLVINLMTLHAVQKGKITVLGGGHQWRPLIHVRDVADGFIAVLEAPESAVQGEVFNLGLENYQVLTLAYMVRETLPFRIDIDIAPDDADKRDYFVDFSKMQSKLGFTPSRSITDGIEEVYNALKTGQVRSGPETSTVGWYRQIIEAEKLLNRIRLNGRLI